mmetsp:Transcript_95226/g.306858  ORF Transcript_95226/g.306858 Transcript_95226/m.306858 type:complete len:287 (-) Transcript_95226:762-1622(-)
MGLVLAPESSCGSPCAEPRRELLPRAGLGAGPTFPSKAGAASPAAASAKLWHEQYLRSQASQQLLTVVRNGDLLLVKAALTGLAVPDCCDGAGVTPLHAAVDGGHDEILVVLLARRASPEAPGGPLFDGPPAALASRRGHEDIRLQLSSAWTARKGLFGCAPQGSGHAACKGWARTRRRNLPALRRARRTRGLHSAAAPGTRAHRYGRCAGRGRAHRCGAHGSARQPARQTGPLAPACRRGRRAARVRGGAARRGLQFRRLHRRRGGRPHTSGGDGFCASHRRRDV